MKIRTVSMLACLLVMLSIIATTVFAAESVAECGILEVASATGNGGDIVSLNVDMPANVGIATMSIRISYDDNALELIRVEDTGILKGASLNATYGSPYQITWVDGSTLENNTQTGTIATLTFRILEGVPAGDYAIALECLSAYDVKYEGKQFATISGKVNVHCSGHSFSEWIVETPATTTAGGSKYRVCTACGEREDKVIPQTLKVSSATLTLESKVEVNFKCKVAATTDYGYTDIYMVFEMNGRKVKVTEYEKKGADYIFDFSELAPDLMGDSITAILYGTYEGELYQSAPQPYSVKQYCTKQLQTATGDFQNLLIELLNYGAAAQVYRKYKTDALVNEGITGGLGEIAPYVTDQALTGTVANELLVWKSGTMVLDEAVTQRIKFQAADLTGIQIKVSINGRNYTFTKDSSELKRDTASGANRYMLDVNSIGVQEMRDAVTFKAYKDGELISKTLTYSAESYAVKNANTTTPLGKLVNAMMKYGDAAKAYVS